MPPAPSAAAQDHDKAQQVELILRQVDNLPTLSSIATRLLEVGTVEDADLDRIVEIIETDPALTARLLGLCRRADKGLGDRITTVRRAVVMLGLEAVQAAVLSVAVYELMGRCMQKAQAIDDDPGSGTTLEFDRAGFWKHSIAVASACELIAEGHLDLGVKPEEAFVAGLLHDLGKLVLDLILPRSYARVLGLAERRGCSSTDAELQLIGLDHHTAGKRLAEHWRLPAALADSMWLYGQPIDSLPDLPHRNIIGIVGVARALCRHLHLGWSGDFNHPEPLEGPRGICGQFGLSAELVQASVSRLHESVLHRCRVLGLGDQTTPELLMEAVAAANRRLGRLSATFEQRSRQSQRQGAVLQAISEFHAAGSAGRPGRGVIETLGDVVRSASGILGRGFYGVVYQLRDGDPWQLCQFAADGRPTRSQVIETPPGAAQAGGRARLASLAGLCGTAQLSMGAMALLPWLADYLIDAGDLRNVQLLPLCARSGELTPAPGPAAVLLHDRDLPGSVDRATLEPLTATWGSAVAAAAQHEAARRLGERLASSNRSLAEAQAKLAEVESMARLGEMAAGAAHEMNNPLTVISGRAQLLLAGAREAGEKAAAAAIVEAAQNLTSLITSLRLLADPPRPQLQATTAREVAELAVTRAEAMVAGASARIRTEIQGSGESVVDRELIATAAAELLANAVQASEETPVVLKVHTGRPDRRLMMVVHDQGTGMSPRALQHAFDPFFSEKPAGRRTGLGLTRARRLVELHGGEVWLQSTPGQGTTATISLPAPEQAAVQTGFHAAANAA